MECKISELRACLEGRESDAGLFRTSKQPQHQIYLGPFCIGGGGFLLSFRCSFRCSFAICIGSFCVPSSGPTIAPGQALAGTNTSCCSHCTTDTPGKMNRPAQTWPMSCSSLKILSPMAPARRLCQLPRRPGDFGRGWLRGGESACGRPQLQAAPL